MPGPTTPGPGQFLLADLLLDPAAGLRCSLAGAPGQLGIEILSDGTDLPPRLLIGPSHRLLLGLAQGLQPLPQPLGLTLAPEVQLAGPARLRLHPLPALLQPPPLLVDLLEELIDPHQMR